MTLINTQRGIRKPMEEKRLLNPDELHEECGVYGMYDFDGNDVASEIYTGLFACSTGGRRAAVLRSVTQWDRRGR